jgi:hypothetical protein
MKKFKFALFAALLFGSFANAKYIGTYYAKLGVLDHFNSSGKRLTKASAIIRQDRYNFHIRNIKDSLDTWDPFFDSKRNRAILEKMLRRGNASSSALNAIVNSTPLIKVTVYDDHINVKVLKSAPKSSIE